MAFETNLTKVVCYRCGRQYGQRKGLFPVSYALNYKGIGYLPICRDCLDTQYNVYLSQSNNAKDAVRQICRKYDIYWDEKLFENALKLSATRSVLTSYLTKVNAGTYAGRSYDDTLEKEGTLWTFGSPARTPSLISAEASVEPPPESSVITIEPMEITEDMIDYWGSGYTPEMYTELERSRRKWMKGYQSGTEGIDMGTEVLIKQVCKLELKINSDQAAGKSIDKNINVLNTLLGSLKIKPVQKNSDDDSSLDKTPYGVWIAKLEHHRPISEPSEEFKDVDGIVKKISTWFLGHLGKMLGLKNVYTKLYDDAIARYRVASPDITDEDDDAFLSNFFGEESERGEEVPSSGNSE